MSSVWVVVIGIGENGLMTGTQVHEEDYGVERVQNSKSQSKLVGIEVLLDRESSWRS